MSSEDEMTVKWDNVNEWEREMISMKTANIASIRYCPMNWELMLNLNGNCLVVQYPNGLIAWEIYNQLLEDSNKIYTEMRIK